MILESLHASVRAAGPISSRSNYQGFHGSNKADLFYDQTVISEVSQDRSQVVLFRVQSRVDPFMTVILELEVGCLTSWSNCNFSNRAGPTLSFMMNYCAVSGKKNNNRVDVFMTSACQFRDMRAFHAGTDFRDQGRPGVHWCGPFHYVCGGGRVYKRHVHMQSFSLHC